jgi:hypothetical protein
MKKINTIFQFALVLFFMSCDWKSKIAVIKNNTSDTIVIVPWDDQELGAITDSMIYNDRIDMPDLVEPGKSAPITLPGRNFDKAPDSSKLQLYVLNVDSLSHYRQLRSNHEILGHCLHEKITIQANKIGKGLDTINIR